MGKPAPDAPRRAAAASAGAVAIAGAAPRRASAGARDDPTPLSRRTGNDSELIDRGPDRAPSREARDRVAMRIAPDELRRRSRRATACAVERRGPGLDDLRRLQGRAASARPYEFNPTMTARIVLVAAPEGRSPGSGRSRRATAGALQAAAPEPKPPLHDHDPRTPRPRSATSARLPCQPDACYVNLIVGAPQQEGQRGNLVVLGGRPARRLGRAGQGPAQRRPGPTPTSRRRRSSPSADLRQRPTCR